MAISSVGSYANSYENLYVSNQTKKSETSEISEAKSETAKKSNNEEYLKTLQKQVPYIKLQTGYGINTNNDGKVNVVDVNPKLLEKMQNDPKAANEYTQRLKDVESALKFGDNFSKSMGHTVVASHAYVDENGHMSYYAYVIKKDVLNEKHRKEAQENAEKQIEKTRENARKKTEQIAEKAEEEITESVQDSDNTAKEKAEQMLLEKIGTVNDGEIHLNDEDMQLIVEATQNNEGTIRNSALNVGGKLDIKI